MYQATTRKIGSSVTITIPKELHAEVNKIYLISKNRDGSFVLVPKIENPLDQLSKDFKSEDFFSDDASGREVF